MIVRITLSEDRVLLVGNSYKPWLDQFKEYVSRFKDQLPAQPLKVEVSKEKWKSWGGLKWCFHENFQYELNREGCQADDPDNPNPRQYADMVFKVDPWVWGKVTEVLVRAKVVA